MTKRISKQLNSFKYKGEPIKITIGTLLLTCLCVLFLIMATFTPRDKNFNSLAINNLALVVTKQMIDTTVLEWTCGASVEKLGTADGDKYTTYTNLEKEPGVSRNVYYDGAYCDGYCLCDDIETYLSECDVLTE